MMNAHEPTDTTSVRISRLTQLWVKRVQGFLRYQGADPTIDNIIAIAVIEYDYQMAKRYNLTKENRDKYFDSISDALIMEDSKNRPTVTSYIQDFE